MEEKFDKIRPIAYIETDFSEKFGIPRQSGRVPSLFGRIVFLPEFRNETALRGIEDFSHLWLIFDFSKSHREEWSPTVRPPRLGGNKRIGVFASRSPFRPNPIGLSCVKLERIEKTEHEGAVLIVSGVDLLSGTPIYDIKPYIPFADCIPEATGSYSDEHRAHRLEVVFPNELLVLIPSEKHQAVLDCLADDPRPSYQDDCERVYSMKFANFDIDFTVNENVLAVIGVKRLTD